MRSDLVVVSPPEFDAPSGVGEGCEPVLVEALVPEASLEVVDEAVLVRLARPDEVEGGRRSDRAGVQGLPVELGPVLADEDLGKPAGPGRALQDVHDSGSGARMLDLQPRPFPDVVINQRQAPEAAPGGQDARDEVAAPALVGAPR